MLSVFMVVFSVMVCLALHPTKKSRVVKSKRMSAEVLSGALITSAFVNVVHVSGAVESGVFIFIT